MMAARVRIAWLCAVTAALWSAPAAAERLVMSLSTHRVLINSQFTGAEIVLFGAIERDAQTRPHRGGYDLVVTVTGPRQTMVTRRKERKLGIWVNTDSRTFVEVPSYLGVLANRPVAEITDADTLRRQQVGVERTLLRQIVGPDVADVVATDPMRSAFVRLKAEQQLYYENAKGVTLLTPALFRAVIPMPANVQVGTYDVDVKLFADGALITRANSAMEIIKIGFEQFVASAAHNYGTLYGLVTTLMALLTGWLASVVFRRD